MKEGRVLVVDDEPMVRETLGQFLSDEGYVVDLAVDGETALERVHAARPDAILLDLMMPGMNGRQFLQALREEPAYAHVPVLIMTAVHGLEVNFATLGASDVVEKPFHVEELLNKVALAVYRSRESITTTGPLPAVPAAAEPVAEKERGVVLLVEHDRSRLQQLDMRPRAILLDWVSEGVGDVVRELADTSGLEQIPILVFSRNADTNIPGTLEQAADVDLVGFVERQRDRQVR